MIDNALLEWGVDVGIGEEYVKYVASLVSEILLGYY